MKQAGWRRWFVLAWPLIPALAVTGCLSRVRRSDPFYESFYEKTSLIMTEEEDHIYRAIKDRAEKEEFIQEFWRIRDPDSGTEENEARREFEDRIDFANRWLGHRRGSEFRPEAEERAERSRGWATDRGRIYVVLGPPDFISAGMGYEPLRNHLLNRGSSQYWYYRRYDLKISFSRTNNGIWRMGLHSPVFQAMATARLELVSPSYRGSIARPFRFRAVWKDGGIKLVFPADRISFKEADERLRAEIRVRINVYLENRRLDNLVRTRVFSYTEKEAEYLKEIELHFPFDAPEKGEYLFDIIATDLLSLSRGRFRSYVKKKL